jgi:hypothetical protein
MGPCSAEVADLARLRETLGEHATFILILTSANAPYIENIRLRFVGLRHLRA